MSFDFKKLSILVVEDSEPILKLVASVLETLGVGKCFTAKDGKEAFQIFCEKKPDIVITDWQMKPVDGLALIKLIRTNKKSPNKLTPIIIITGYSAMLRVAKARDIGTTEFLVKPFSASDLANRIAHVIAKPRDYIDSDEFFGPDRRRKKVDVYSGPKRREAEGV